MYPTKPDGMTDPKPCPRCGQVACDYINPVTWQCLIDWLNTHPRDETIEPDDVEPFI